MRLIRLVAGASMLMSVWACETSSPTHPLSKPSSPSDRAPAGAGGSTVAPGAGVAGNAGAAGEGAAIMAGAGGTSSTVRMSPDAGSGIGTDSDAMTADSSDWRPLVTGAWELPAGQEGYRCVRLTMTEDIYIKEFQPIAPPGTHHTLLSVNETPQGPDGISECTAGDNGLVTLLGSGVGEHYSAGPLPDGVAYKVAKGAQLNLNLHIFNVGDSTLKGESGTKVRTTTADKVSDFAETILAGPLSLSIPPGRSTAQGRCTIMSDTTVFAIAPHMHQLGVYLKAVLNRATGDDVTLFDGAYDFEDQRQSSTGRLALKSGDTVQVECTYENPTSGTVGFGQSSLDEMCFIGLYRYPIAGEALICGF